MNDQKNQTPDSGARKSRGGRLARLLRASATVFGAGLVFGALGLLTLALLFAQGDPGLSRRVLSLANDALGTDSTRIAADRVSGRLFGAAELSHPRLLVRTREGNVTWAEAHRMRIEFDLMQFLFGHRHSLRVTIDGPRVDLVHDPRGDLVVPRFATRGGHGPSETTTEIEVRFRDGGFRLDRGGVAFGSIDGELVARVEPDRTTLLVKRLTGRSQMKGRPGLVQVDGRAIVTGHSMRIEPLSVALDSTRVNATVDWDLAAARVVTSSIRFAPLDLGEAMGLLHMEPVVRGKLRGEVTFAGDPTSGSARVRLSGLVEGESVDSVSASGTMVPGAIRVEDMVARVRGGQIEGSGILETRGAMTADLRLRGFDPADLPWLRATPGVPHASLSARVSFAALRARPHPIAEMTVALEPGALGRARIEGGMLHVRHAADGTITLDSARVDIPGGRIAGRGTLGPDRTLALRVSGSVRELGSMTQLLKPVSPEEGTGHLEADVSGPLSAPGFHAKVVLAQGRLSNGLRFDSLLVRARGTLGETARAEATVRASGLTAGRRALGSAIASLSYAGRTLTLVSYRQVQGDTTIAVSGRLAFQPGKATASLDSVLFEVGGRAWRNAGAVEATLAGDRIHVSKLRFGLESGSLDLAGDLWLSEPRLDVRGSVRGLDLARAASPHDSTARVRGTASVDFEARGPLKDPDVTAAVEVLAPQLRGFAADSLTLRVRYEPGLLTLDEARLAGGGGRVEAVGTAEPELPLEDWIRSAVRGDSTWARRMPLELSLQAEGVDLRRLAPLSPSLGTLAGTATARVRVTGTAAEPKLDLSARGVGLAFRGVSVEQASLTGAYQAERLTIQNLSLTRGTAVSTIRGFVPVDLSLGPRRHSVADDSMRLEVRMAEADFSIAAVLVPQIAASSGKLTVNADLAGTPAHPDVTGSLRLREGTLRFAGRDEVLEGVELDGTLNEDGITATRIAAREDKKGQLKGSGWWRYVRGTPLGQYEIKVRARDFTATDRETYLLRFTGDFVIGNGRSASGEAMPLITGSAVLSRGELTWTQEPAGAEERPPTPFLYEVTLEAPRNLWFRNLDTEVELATSGRLLIKNDGQGDYLLGTLDVLRGRYYVCYSKFQIVSGTVSFRTVDKIDPEVTLDAETRVPSADPAQPNEVIKMSLSGPSSQLKVTLYDGDANPALLWKKLCIGQVSSLGSEEVSAGGAGAGGTSDVTLPIRDYLFRNVERWLGDVGIIDTIDLKSGEVTTRTPGVGAPTISSVGVGKYVTPELYLRYSRDFSGTAERKISAEYRVTRYLLLKGEQIQGQQQQGVPETQYNLDLKLRIEY